MHFAANLPRLFRIAALTASLSIYAAPHALSQAPASSPRPAPQPSALQEGCPAPSQRRMAPPGTTHPQDPPDGTATTPTKRLLIWADTRNGIAQHDSVSHAMALIEELGYKSGLYTTYIRTDSNIISRNPKMTTGQPASGGPSLCNVDAIFFLGHREIELDPQGRADLLWFVHDAGKGFVASHTATGAFLSWPEFGDLLGGRYDGHPWNTTSAKVIVSDPAFPGMAQFGTSFDFKDEFYQTSDFSPATSRVLLRLDTSNLDMSRPGVHPADYPYPLAWAKMYGKGRVFYSSLGHASTTWDDPRVQQMYFEAIKWALGLVDASVTPLPVPPASK